MKYRVHRLEVTNDTMQEKLEQFLNNLEGEVVSIIPNITRYIMMYGAKITFLLITEKTKQ
ncbi:MAG: hypothetical protein Q8S39_01580 [Ignavibacteria bacterium]|nr:hypothetical protein [Ignavibacteria bacterium]MDP3580592.1 hypothetical protein [Ignavibacteria bacterium]